MVKTTKRIVLVLVILSVLMLSCVACTQSASQNTTAAATGSTAASTQGTASGTTTAATEAPAEFSLFMSNSGITIPDNVDPADNPYIKKIEELANVKITSITIPPYADFETKLNLMLSSGEIADLVHNFQVADVNKAAAAGAFLEVSDIIDKSPVISSIYTEQVKNAIRYTDGKIYQIRAVAPPDPYCLVVRYDLVKSLNAGVMPTTPDEWYQLLKKVKEADPNNIPFSDFGGLGSTTAALFYPYGVEIPTSGTNGWQYTNGSYIHCFEAKYMKDALLYVKKLYDEGLMSKTFVTNTQQDFSNEKLNNNVLFWGNNLGSASMVYYSNNSIDNQAALIVPAPIAVTNLPGIDPTNAIPRINELNWGHNVVISSKAKNVDGIVRFIETMLSEDVTNLFVYGLEDVDYKIENGEKVMQTVAGDPDHKFRSIYGFLQGYNSRASMDLNIATRLSRSTAANATKTELKTAIDSGTEQVYKAAKTVPTITAKDFVTLSEEFTNKANEGKELAKSIILKAITGEITMDEYDAQSAAFLETYKPVTDEYNRVLAAAKTQYNID
ncbi:MAG: extracellular solute-binding protein [Clostridiaceae bacterium]|nr:extracellular solute-binding protein [Clostridiaceae bacterium]